MEENLDQLVDDLDEAVDASAAQHQAMLQRVAPRLARLRRIAGLPERSLEDIMRDKQF